MTGSPRDKEMPPSRAMALGYEKSKQGAPSVRAKGRGEVAQRILELASKNEIPIRREPDLLRLLEPLELGEEIPFEAYQAVAEILAFLYRVGGREDSAPSS